LLPAYENFIGSFQNIADVCKIFLLFGTLYSSLHDTYFQLDETEDKCSWKAIGNYGPDSEFKARIKRHFLHGTSKGGQDSEEGGDEAEQAIGPLYKGLVHLNCPRDIIVDALRRIVQLVSCDISLNFSIFFFKKKNFLGFLI
jgi:hypothetical protein